MSHTTAQTGASSWLHPSCANLTGAAPAATVRSWVRSIATSPPGTACMTLQQAAFAGWGEHGQHRDEGLPQVDDPGHRRGTVLERSHKRHITVVTVAGERVITMDHTAGPPQSRSPRPRSLRAPARAPHAPATCSARSLQAQPGFNTVTFRVGRVGTVTTPNRWVTKPRSRRPGLRNDPGLSLPAGPFTATMGNCPTTLAAGRSCNLSVSFTPTVVGPVTGCLTVTSNAVGSPRTVALTGTGR